MSKLTALGRTALVALLVMFVSIALVPCGVVMAETVNTNFDGFSLGTVNGQGGWKSARSATEFPPIGDIPSCFKGPTKGKYDQEVVKNSLFYPGGIPGFEAQSLRMSNLCPSGEFTFQTYSTPVKDPASESGPNTEFIAQFSFITTTTKYQEGLNIGVSPDNYEGARMSYVGLEETPDGTAAYLADIPGVDGETEFHPLVEKPLTRGVPHTIRFWIKLNPGADNDVQRVSIDGVDAGQCYATWENYYRLPENAGPPHFQLPPPINSLQFRSRFPGFDLTNGGYLFDNVTVTTANRGGPPGCDEPIEKQAESRTVRPGGVVRYRINVRNRGHLAARNSRVCDRIPSGMTFVSADRKLSRLGDRRCLVIQRLAPGQRFSFHVSLRAAADAPPGNTENIAEETPVGPPGAPSVPPAVAADVPGKVGVAAVIERAKAIVKVVGKRSARPRAAPPVTG